MLHRPDPRGPHSNPDVAIIATDQSGKVFRHANLEEPHIPPDKILTILVLSVLGDLAIHGFRYFLEIAINRARRGEYMTQLRPLY